MRRAETSEDWAISVFLHNHLLTPLLDGVEQGKRSKSILADDVDAPLAIYKTEACEYSFESVPWSSQREF